MFDQTEMSAMKFQYRYILVCEKEKESEEKSDKIFRALHGIWGNAVSENQLYNRDQITIFSSE